jgi:HK97 family phage major capsid protein
VRIGPPSDLGVLVSVEAMAASFGRMFHAAVDDTAAATLRSGGRIGTVPQLHAPIRFLDVLPAIPSPVPARDYTYAVESGNIDTAAPVAEGALPPEAGVVLTDATVTFRGIRHYVKAQREMLADTPGLQDRLGARLVQGVYSQIEAQALTGNGAGQNLRGILATSGVADVPFTTGALIADQVRAGIAALEAAGAGRANFVALSVADDRTLDTTKTSGSGEYLAGPFASGPGTLWGVPRTVVPKMATGTAIVGNTNVDGVPSARLVVREPVGVLISDSDQDDFLRRKVTLHAVSRVALEVAVPAAFAVVHLA